ncbi:MAG: DUF2156 domain-containing protein [Planctomycetes bacterium]|nr:DUF2156 domain-containing protein [Planctomycetota bacterium]
MPAPRPRDLELLACHGRTTTSFHVAAPAVQRFRCAGTAGADAVVGYVDTGSAWVAVAGPIAQPARIPAALGAFRAAARAAGRRAVWFGIEEPDAETPGLRTLKVGEQPVWRTADWPAVLARKRSLREQLRRARAKGVTVRRVAPAELARPEAPLRRAIESLVDRWLRTRAMAPMGFVVRIAPFEQLDERRFFVAERASEPCAILIAVPLPARGRAVLQDALRDPRAPNGTMELLFDAALRQLAADDIRDVTFGLAPLARVTAAPLQLAARWSRWLYDFRGLLHFKEKLTPGSWRPVHVAFDADVSPFRAIVEVLRAFAGGSLWAFGWRTLVHRAPAVAGLGALLLAPWIAILAVADVPHWFPSRGVQLAWIALDVVLALGLTALWFRWSARLAAGVAGLALADTLLGIVQFATHNHPRLRHPGELLAAAFALLAPIALAALLWAARDRAGSLRRSAALAAGAGGTR